MYRLFLLLCFISLPAFATNVMAPTNNFYSSFSAAQNACSSDPSKASEACQSGVGWFKWVYSLDQWGNRRSVDPVCENNDPWITACQEHWFFYSAQCPDGSQDNGSGLCQCTVTGEPYTDPATCPVTEPCTLGSVTSDCAVQCPALQYTYYLNDQQYHGSMSAGIVGYGMSCPEPEFPDGNQQACVSTDPNGCEPTADAVHESQDVTTETTTTTTTQNPDGTTSTSTSSTSSTATAGGGATSTTGTRSTGAGGANSAGEPVQPDPGCTSGACISDDQVDIAGTKYQLCGHGGIVHSAAEGGCDYIPPSCSGFDVPTKYGCIDVPMIEPPSTPREPNTTVTEETTTDGPTTTTTTTTKTTTGSTGSSTGGTGGGDNAVPSTQSSTGRASGTCSAPPRSTGDAQLHAILMQQWQAMCFGSFEAPTGSSTAELTQRIEAAKTELNAGITQIKTEIQQSFGVVEGGGDCVPNNVTIRGVAIDFSFCRWYQYFSIVGAVVMALAAFWSVSIVLRG